MLSTLLLQHILPRSVSVFGCLERVIDHHPSALVCEQEDAQPHPEASEDMVSDVGNDEECRVHSKDESVEYF